MSCVIADRDNPLDAGGTKWHPPTLICKNDTIVSFTQCSSIVMNFQAMPGAGSKKIETYYWDVGLDGLDDSSENGTYTISSKSGGKVAVRWGVKDNDGVKVYDTFKVTFNRAPTNTGIIFPKVWDINFDHKNGIGNLLFKFDCRDPDTVDTLLDFSFFIGKDTDLKLVYSGKNNFFEYKNCYSNQTEFYKLVIHDSFGDSAVTSGKLEKPAIPPMGVYDIEGNFYPAIQYGDQVWTTVNFRSTKYNDGTPIDPWKGYDYRANYHFYHDTTDTEFIKKNGALYSYPVVGSGKLSPKGWHIPTLVECKKLEKHLFEHGFNYDSSTSQPKVAKAMASTTDWIVSTKEGMVGNKSSLNNSSGFSAYPSGRFGGEKWDYYRWFDLGSATLWWSSDLAAGGGVYCAFLNLAQTSLGYNWNPNMMNISVRLVMD